MHNRLKWMRHLSPLIVAVVLSACSQSQMIPLKTETALPDPTSRSVQVSEAKETAQTAPAIATFQTQPRTTGFSADGRYFLHLESWRDKGAGIPHAALQVVDLSANQCVANGCLRTRWGEAKAGQTTTAAENDLMQQTQQLRQDLKLTTPAVGTVLPVLARSRSADGTEVVTVTLKNNESLRLTLTQKRIASSMAGGTAATNQAAMQLEVAYAGKTRSLGSLDQLKDSTVEFSIREVQQSLDGKTVAVLLTAAEQAFEGTLGRTTVQGFAL